MFSLSTIPCNYRMSVSNLFICTSASDLLHCMPMRKTLGLDRVPAWWWLHVPKNTDWGYDFVWPLSLVITILSSPSNRVHCHHNTYIRNAQKCIGCPSTLQLLAGHVKKALEWSLIKEEFQVPRGMKTKMQDLLTCTQIWLPWHWMCIWTFPIGSTQCW